MARSFSDRQTELWAFIKRADRKNSKLAIFIHGWRGGYLSTWGDLAQYLEIHADTHDVFREWDYLFLGYETYSVSSLLDIAELVAERWSKASRGEPPFEQQYEKLALVGHSLGTLGIRQLLCALSIQPNGLLTAIKKVLLLGSPMNGSPLAGYADIGPLFDLFRGKVGALHPDSYQINDALRPDGQILKMLHTWNSTVRKNNYPNIPIKVVLGTNDRVVGPKGMTQWDGDTEVRTTPHSHSTLCKVPGGQTEALIIDELKGVLA